MTYQPRCELTDPHDDRRIAMDRSPVWMVNLSLMVGCIAFLAVLGAPAMFAAGQPWPLAPALVWVFVLLPIWALAMLAYRMSMTAYTRIVIDEERLTWCEGLFNRRLISVELYRIQNAEASVTWWQQAAGFGALILETSDAAYPLWILPGISQVKPLREALIRYSIGMRTANGVREFNTGRV
jgi:uncharacterized membrane protein YdbT with pleckstrin-like domain